MGVNLGVGLGGLPEMEAMHDTWKAGGFRKISPFFIIQIAPNLLAGQVSLLLDFRGANMSVASACATSGHALGEAAGITVTGRVEDVRPWLAHAHAVAAPLRIARGIQNKVLEALAMGKVILATPEAWEGIEDFEGRQGCVSDSPEVMATEALRWLDAPQVARVPEARAMVLSRFDWVRNLDTYEAVLSNAQAGAASVDVAGIDALEAHP